MKLKWLAGIIVVAVALRLAAAFALGDSTEGLPGIHDQIFYHQLANRLLAGHGFTFATLTWPLTRAGEPTAHWSFLYTLFVTGMYALAGPHPLAPRLVQAVVAGVLMPWLTYRLARRVWPDGSDLVALLAAAWTAVYGYFAYYAAALMTETLYIIGILWAFDVTLRLADRLCETTPDSATGTRWRLWAELGLAIAFTIYLRQVFSFFVPFLFLWLAATMWPRRSRFAWGGLISGGLLSVAIVALLILPATLYNYQRFHRFVLLNTNAGYAFFWANHPIYGDHFISVLLPPEMPAYPDLIPAELRQLDEAAMENALLQRGLGFVVADPGRYLRLSLSRIPVYFQFWPSSELSLPSNLVRVASFGFALPFMLAGLGLWAAGLRRGGGAAGGLLLLFALVYSAAHILSWALIRYRLPVDAVLLVFAGRSLAALLHVVLPHRTAL